MPSNSMVNHILKWLCVCVCVWYNCEVAQERCSKPITRVVLTNEGWKFSYQSLCMCECVFALFCKRICSFLVMKISTQHKPNIAGCLLFTQPLNRRAASLYLWRENLFSFHFGDFKATAHLISQQRSRYSQQHRWYEVFISCTCVLYVRMDIYIQRPLRQII